MKRISYSVLAIAMLFAVACNSEAKKDKDAATTEVEAQPKTNEVMPANQPKSYKVVFSPDSAILGKTSEALVKVMGGTAVVLQDPDGKENGIELSIKLQATNRQSIGDGSSFSISYSDARLQLDNSTSITTENGTDYLRAEPESSSKIETWTFKIPAGAKPTTLNLFMNETRVSIGVKLD